MSHGLWYAGAMIPSRRSLRCAVPIPFAWSHRGITYRVTPWPEVKFERSFDHEWFAVTPAAEVLVAGSAAAQGRGWQAYCEFVPPETREFVGYFRRNRLTALLIAARCPGLLDVLTATPALTSFVAEQAAMRSGGSCWQELGAIGERAGVFGVLEWLGLPASRHTLGILRNVVSPDLPAPLLGALRTVLWRPEGIFALGQMPLITDEDLAATCHALAA